MQSNISFKNQSDSLIGQTICSANFFLKHQNAKLLEDSKLSKPIFSLIGKLGERIGWMPFDSEMIEMQRRISALNFLTSWCKCCISHINLFNKSVSSLGRYFEKLLITIPSVRRCLPCPIWRYILFIQYSLIYLENYFIWFFLYIFILLKI